MKPLSLLFLGVVVGWAASGVDWSREAVGQDAPDFAPQPAEDLQRRVDELQRSNREAAQRPPVSDTIEIPASVPGRYQISANESGCYRVDTATGRVWHLVPSTKPQVIAGEVDVEAAK